MFFLDERLYPLQHGQGVFETGMAQGKQLLLGNTAQEILLHWFAPNGEFLELQAIRYRTNPTAEESGMLRPEP